MTRKQTKPAPPALPTERPEVTEAHAAAYNLVSARQSFARTVREAQDRLRYAAENIQQTAARDTSHLSYVADEIVGTLLNLAQNARIDLIQKYAHQVELCEVKLELARTKLTADELVELDAEIARRAARRAE